MVVCLVCLFSFESVASVPANRKLVQDGVSSYVKSNSDFLKKTKKTSVKPPPLPETKPFLNSLSQHVVENGSALPLPLSAKDAERYRRVFDFQEKGYLKKADNEIALIHNKMLMGHVLSQRYLHPTAYRSRYKELKNWLANYADFPDAKKIYSLAIRRGRKSGVIKPEEDYLYGNGGVISSGGWLQGGAYSHLSTSKRRQAKRILRNFRNSMRRGHTKSTKNILKQKKTKRLLTRTDYDSLRAAQGFAYFLDKRDDWAIDWAKSAADRSGHNAPIAQWAAGLAAWRLNKLDLACHHFEALAQNKKTSPWLTSAGAYWASRSNLKARKPENVTKWLDVAAKYPRTFYGILARRSLGLKIDYDWGARKLTQDSLDAMMSIKFGKRAFALLQIGQNERAEKEMRKLYTNVPESLHYAMMFLSEKHGMPALALRLSALIKERDGFSHDKAGYPLPEWRPKDGWQLDKALIYAFVRQESSFNPVAKSHAGARGLMQIMPRTASFITRDRRLRWDRKKRLNDPAFNLSVGQRYLEHLISDRRINGNMFLLLAAYNGGPGNLSKWRKRMDYRNDPLLFIESIPSKETRIYIERVFTNMWIYRSRLGQPMPTLDDVATGKWPIYTKLDRQLAKK